MKKNPKTIGINITTIIDYNRILSYIKQKNIQNVQIYVSLFVDKIITIEKFLEISERNLPIETYNISEQNIVKIDKKYRKKLENLILPLANLDSKIMSHEQFFEYIDKIVYFINHHTKNDYQKVLLLSEIIRKNFKYDNRFYLGLNY